MLRQVIRQWSCDEHVKCVAYDTEVLPAGEEGADRGPFVAVLAASGLFQVLLAFVTGDACTTTGPQHMPLGQRLSAGVAADATISAHQQGKGFVSASRSETGCKRDV